MQDSLGFAACHLTEHCVVPSAIIMVSVKLNSRYGRQLCRSIG